MPAGHMKNRREKTDCFSGGFFIWYGCFLRSSHILSCPCRLHKYRLYEAVHKPSESSEAADSGNSQSLGHNGGLYLEASGSGSSICLKDAGDTGRLYFVRYGIIGGWNRDGRQKNFKLSAPFCAGRSHTAQKKRPGAGASARPNACRRLRLELPYFQCFWMKAVEASLLWGSALFLEG